MLTVFSKCDKNYSGVPFFLQPKVVIGSFITTVLFMIQENWCQFVYPLGEQKVNVYLRMKRGGTKELLSDEVF